jgi:hypothetical protein
MQPLFKKSGNDLPLVYEIDPDAFHKYKMSWLLYRQLGRYDGNGDFEPPLNFLEARQLPKEEMDFYFQMDEIMRKKIAQLRKQKGK